MHAILKSWGLAATGVFLLVQSIYLVTVKVTHLGVILPACIGLALLFWAVAGERFKHSLKRYPLGQKIGCGLRWGFGVWLISVLVFFGVLASHPSTSDEGHVVPAVIVVLGSSTPQGKPSPALVQRLDLANKLAHKYPNARVIVSGGVDFRQTVAEARVMSDYLQAKGLGVERIVLEDRSTSTHENLVFSLRLLQSEGQGGDTPMLLVSSDFHTLRAAKIARKAGWTQVTTAGAVTPLYMRYNAWLREYFAFFSGLLWREY